MESLESPPAPPEPLPEGICPTPRTRREILERRAKVILYGGVTFLALSTAILGTWKLAILLGWDLASPGALFVRQYRTPDGRILAGAYVDDLVRRAEGDLATCGGLYDRSLQAYAAGETIRALVLVTRARERSAPLADEIRGISAGETIHPALKHICRLDEDIGFKLANWRRGLDVNEAEALQQALAEAGDTGH